jgi:hypothetical protein
MQDKFGQVLVPVEEVVEMKNGQKSISERKFFPGYVLVEMDMDDDSWHLVKSTPKVTGFVGGTSTKPTPISEKEVNKIMQQVQDGVEKPRPKVTVRGGRDGAHQGRSRSPTSTAIRRGSQLRKEPPARVGDHFRSRHAGGTGVRSGRKGLKVFTAASWRLASGSSTSTRSVSRSAMQLTESALRLTQTRSQTWQRR